MEIPGLGEDTIPVEESRMAWEDTHEEENLAGLQCQSADSVEEGSMEESTDAVGISEDLTDAMLVAEIAAAVVVAVDFVDSEGEFVGAVAAAPVDLELVALTKDCRLGEHSAYTQRSDVLKHFHLVPKQSENVI